MKAAVVPGAKTIFPAAGPVVEVGCGVEPVRTAVAVAREAAVVGLGGM